MSKRYPGNFITGNPVALTQTSNNGIWDLKDNYTATGNGTWQEVDGIYEIDKSLRFRGSSTNTYLSRTPAIATPSGGQTYTISAWVKRGTLGTTQAICGANYTGTVFFDFYFTTSNTLNIYINSGVGSEGFVGSAYYRDTSAWYHIVVRGQHTNAIASNRLQVYVNGVSAPGTYAYPSTSFGTSWGISSRAHYVGSRVSGTWNFDGHIAEFNSIDEMSLDPSYFGYTDPITGTWCPKQYTGLYGTNGFYLPFKENQSVYNLGRNFAGSNYFTYSQLGSDTSYQLTNASITASNTTAPDGSLTGNKLTEGSGTATQHRTFKQYSVQSSGAVMCTSVYVKAGTKSTVNIEHWSGSVVVSLAFNLSTGQPIYTGAVDANAMNWQYVGNGWYRFWGYTTSNGSGVPSLAVYLTDATGSVTYNGDGTSYVYFWGFQSNLGTKPDKYLATTSATLINDWTPTNISLTAGATYDSSVDSPINVFTTATDTGAVVSGNYCTFNSAFRIYGGNTYSGTFSNGNLTFASSGNPSHGFGTMAVPSTSSMGFYWETVCTSLDSVRTYIGIVDPHAAISVQADGSSYAWPYKALLSSNAGGYFNFASGTSGGTSGTFGAYAVNDTIMVAYKNGSIWFGKNGTWLNSGNPAAGTGAVDTGIDTTKTWLPYVGYSSNFNVNFGQRPFSYTPPAGFVTLNTTNLQALGTTAVYTGSGVFKNITNTAGFQPDFVWIKSRSGAYNHWQFDSVRGAQIGLSSSTVITDNTNPDILTAFNTNGFTLGTSAAGNNAGSSYVAWQWKQSPTSGFNVVGYTGTGVARSITHNLGVAPSFMIVKTRTQASVDWATYHVSSGNTGGNTLNETAAKVTASGWWNNTSPTSSNFTVGTGAQTNGSGQSMIAYLWAEVPGFSKFGSYTGNGSTDGPFVYLGFKPRWVLFKRTDSAENWAIYDSSRNTSNVVGEYLLPNSSSAGATIIVVDFLSNGFKIRIDGTNPGANTSGGTYIYAAFAESPFALNNRAR